MSTKKFIHDLFTETAERRGFAPAVVGANRELSYAELEGWSNNIANLLLSQGITKGDVVALAMDNRFALVASLLGVLKAGGVFMPLDLSQPKARLAGMLEEVSPKVVLTSTSQLSGATALVGDIPFSAVDAEEDSDDQRCLLPRVKDSKLENVSEHPGVERDGDEPCYVYFTSGSTGRPKAILGRLKGIDHFVSWEIETLGLGEDTRGSQLTSPVFDAFLRDVFVPLVAGGVLCVADGESSILTPAGLVHWLEEAKVTLVHTVPSLFRTLLAADLSVASLPNLGHVLLAGEPLLPSDVKRFAGVFGDRIQMVNLYGPSETTMVKLFYLVAAEDAERRSIPIGQAMPGARVLVLDEDLEVCDGGTVGEIYIRTPYRSLGYYGRPELTETVFVQNPHSEDADDKLYRTGDMGRVLDSGELEFLGRRDQQVKIRGVRVELSEIENVALESDLVTEVAVVDRDDESGNKYLCAYVVLSGRTSTDAVRDYLRTRLPETMMPSTILEIEELPTSATGKVDRRALPAPEDLLGSDGEFVEPSTETEKTVAAIFVDVLSRDRVSAADNFFQIGGHSLLAMVLLSRLSETIEVEIPLATLFESPSVAELAAAVDRLKSDAGEADEGILASEDNIGSMLDGMGDLSDDEVASLLEDIVDEEEPALP